MTNEEYRELVRRSLEQPLPPGWEDELRLPDAAAMSAFVPHTEQADRYQELRKLVDQARQDNLDQAQFVERVKTWANDLRGLLGRVAGLTAL
jgi:hypothetical protein